MSSTRATHQLSATVPNLVSEHTKLVDYANVYLGLRCACNHGSANPTAVDSLSEAKLPPLRPSGLPILNHNIGRPKIVTLSKHKYHPQLKINLVGITSDL